MYTFLTVQDWADYELLDTGNFEKLERFGKYILARPEPQAIWDKSLAQSEWDRSAQAVFKKEKGSTEKGLWLLKKGMPEQWFIQYQYGQMDLRFRLGLSSFKHVGIFPEQAPNWRFIYEQARQLKTSQPKILNMFAYTGGASLAARAAGADVTHLDAVKAVNYWARENMEASNLTDIRWIVEDAMKFARREVKRGNKYQGLILDPPAYGRGPNGEKWQLEDELNELFKLCGQLLDPTDNLCLINLYSLGFSALILENLVKQNFQLAGSGFQELGELYLQDHNARKLPLGTFYRFSTGSKT
ncbi:SAM-dependent methyltransferase [Adhaeribacter aerolatus]|uniref:SAM-dependent methyltransferase n=1 Tax=Adhaeribacter aerolatus TaxID=670289 RepID=A0A512ARR4_9BACT|nr:class I SAM-dependent methyltransferase [Adhaeribacter aerolatus]GEO02404.1 SAM-dependent methyltransferase [Adhaeribacter aerolatus]